jgi:hypothetical protein
MLYRNFRSEVYLLRESAGLFEETISYRLDTR